MVALIVLGSKILTLERISCPTARGIDLVSKTIRLTQRTYSALRTILHRSLRCDCCGRSLKLEIGKTIFRTGKKAKYFCRKCWNERIHY